MDHAMTRYIKIALIFFVALQGLVGGIANLANISATYDAVARVLAMEGVPASIPRLFASDTPILVWLGACWIFMLKLSTGGMGAVGVWQLWRSRRASAEEFQSAKRWGLVACGVSILMLFGGFIVIATTTLFMWQAPNGQVGFEGATYFLVCLGIVALYVNMSDD